jgi:hypothetical protein
MDSVNMVQSQEDFVSMATPARATSTVKRSDDSLIVLDRFIQATRDSGYKGTGSAISELVDNSLQAEATRVIVLIDCDPASSDGALRVQVADNGNGMDSATLRQALRFGGSTRFNDRSGLGRYGMGLPNSSLSQARRLEVCTWRSPRTVIGTYLDVDEIASGKVTRIPDPVHASLPGIASQFKNKSGTVVTWTRCDRLDFRKPTTIASRLRTFLGRVFRDFIWSGVTISVNGEKIEAIDPLFVHERSLTRGGRFVGSPLEYRVRLPLRGGNAVAEGRVTVKFSELPVEEWHKLSNEEKQRLGVPKGAGVSVVRAKREIDYGWFFMGDKRKENYDDWWRCEIRFDPALDEVFGITHTKQQIRPTQELLEILVPDIEATAKSLNRRVRQVHERLKLSVKVADAEAIASAKERLLPSLPTVRLSPEAQRQFEQLERRHPRIEALSQGEKKPGKLCYAMVAAEANGTRFFQLHRRNGQLVLALNTDHPFYRRVYGPLAELDEPGVAVFRQKIELVLLAAARAEAVVGPHAGRFLENWSDVIATFLQ